MFMQMFGTVTPERASILIDFVLTALSLAVPGVGLYAAVLKKAKDELVQVLDKTAIPHHKLLAIAQENGKKRALKSIQGLVHQAKKITLNPDTTMEPDLDFAQVTTDLIRHEGLRLTVYPDSVGKLTIGVGRNLEDNGISEVEAKDLLQNDINRCISELNVSLHWSRSLPAEAQIVLINMCFNLGIHKLTRFKRFLSALQQSNWLEAAQEMLDSKWATQVGPRAIELSNRIKNLSTSEAK